MADTAFAVQSHVDAAAVWSGALPSTGMGDGAYTGVVFVGEVTQGDTLLCDTPRSRWLTVIAPFVQIGSG